MSSIKRDVKKKVLPRPEVRKIFGLEIQPTVDPLDGEVCSGGLAVPVAVLCQAATSPVEFERSTKRG
jgi:hypothetical protein